MFSEDYIGQTVQEAQLCDADYYGQARAEAGIVGMTSTESSQTPTSPCDRAKIPTVNHFVILTRVLELKY